MHSLSLPITTGNPHGLPLLGLVNHGTVIGSICETDVQPISGRSVIRKCARWIPFQPFRALLLPTVLCYLTATDRIGSTIAHRSPEDLQASRFQRVGATAFGWQWPVGPAPQEQEERIPVALMTWRS